MESALEYQARPRILVADDEADITTVLADILADQSYLVETAEDGARAWQMAQSDPFDLVITDLKMPRMGGLDLLRHIKEAGHPTAVIIMTGFATVETAIEALKIGAYDYILKPFKVGELLQVVDRALEKIRLEAENLHLKEQIALLKLSEAVASSLSLDEVLGIVVEAALKEVDADSIELLFRPPGSEDFSRRLGLARSGSFAPLLTRVERLEEALEDAPHLQIRGRSLSGLVPADCQVRTLLSVPLRRHGGHLLGVLNAYSHKDKKAFRPREEKALVVLGDRAASSVENALLHDDLQKTFLATIESLAVALDKKDEYTANHSKNVTRLCVATARAMGLESSFCEVLERAGILHDIGKIGVRSAILTKPARLTSPEYEEAKLHATFGYEILRPIRFLRDDVAPIVRHHHERWDGDGYPDGLAQEDIPLGSRIMLVADTYEAMTSTRPYRTALPHEVAVAELTRCSGSQFDPHCVEAFLSLPEKDLGEK